MIIRSRAPVRIDFAGGWTDVALFTEGQPGIVVNAAINVYSYVTLKSLMGIEGNKQVKIYSADFDVYQEANEIKELEYNGNIDLAKAALKRSDIEGRVEMVTRSNAPAGSGLGTSASMGVALIGALNALSDQPMLPYEFAELASAIERHELGILGGKQDHYASALGGINFMQFTGEQVKTSKLKLEPETIYELEKGLVLCYTGKSRLSSNIHQNVVDTYLTRNKATHDALSNLKKIALETKTALLKSDLNSFAELLNENWENQKRLHESVTNSHIDSLFELALNNGAAGGKACGAGGGGCILFFCYPDKEHIVREKLEEANVKIIDFNFSHTGLEVWEPHLSPLESESERPKRKESSDE